MTTPGRRCVLVRVTGQVQGVGFRAWTAGEARRLGIAGWVRNKHDGSVMALVAGNEGAVSALLDAFMHGPPGAHVSDVLWEPSEDDPDLDGFHVVQ